VGIKLEYPVGATPLDSDDAAALIPGHVTTREQLNNWEMLNIRNGEDWAFARRHKDILSINFMQKLHKRMFGDTWSWAGKIRTKETLPVGIAPEHIAVELRNLCDDVESQLQHKNWPFDETAARFHHRLVYIHPFPNGNGRFARTMTDLLLVQNGKQRFTWGAGDLIGNGDARRQYICALHAADAKDYTHLFGFVRSSPKNDG
jgi:Fic-DOC domain mobile mystery protein B